MRKILLATLLWFCLSAASFPLDTISQADLSQRPDSLQNSEFRHVITLPEGGLRNFLRWTPNRVPLVSHHRGGPVPGFPENALETMDNALKYGPGLMEVDVAQLADGTLVLMHDKTIDRTTTGTGAIEKQIWPELKSLFLIDETGTKTPYRIPQLKEVLLWAKGKTILTLDIKPSTDFEDVVQLVQATNSGDYVVAIAYTLEQAISFYKAAPNMPISVRMRDTNDIAAVEGSGIPAKNIVAWTGTKQRSREHYSALHGRGWRVIMGTLGRGPTALDKVIAANDNDARYLEFYREGVDIIATDRFWAVQAQIQNPNFYLFQRKILPRITAKPKG